MDIIEQYVREHELSINNVLRLVDEYTLYAYYLGYTPELARRYKSPIRGEHDEDRDPSFTLFPSNNTYYEYLWKDHARNESGSIFKLIKLIHGLSNLNQVLNLVDQDFELGLGSGKPIVTQKITKYQKPEDLEPTVIRVKTRLWTDEDLAFWNIQGIGAGMLRKYNVFPIECFWTKASQKTPIMCKGLAYAYVIGNYYKIYQPFNPEFKFTTNFPSNYIEGFIQLDYNNSDLLIITKSLKEVMWFKENMNIEAVAGKSESTMIPVEYINRFKAKFKRILLFLDPDRQGYNQTRKYQELYGFEAATIYPCLLTNCKDPTDHNKAYGTELTVNLIKSLLMLN